MKHLTYNNIFTDELITTSKKIRWEISQFSKPRYLLLQCQQYGNGQIAPSTIGVDVGGLSIDNSCFSGSENCLGLNFSQMQIHIGSERVFAEDINNYNFEMYNEMISSQSLNGNQSEGLTSGLITRDEFESGVYAYHFFKLPMLYDTASDSVRKKLIFSATNNSLIANLRIKAFVYYQFDMEININTSQISMPKKTV